MTITTIESCLRRGTVLFACLLATGWLTAQTAPVDGFNLYYAAKDKTKSKLNSVEKLLELWRSDE